MLKKIAALGLPVVFINPPLGFILSFFDIKSKNSAFVYIFFGVLFGFSISFSDSSADSYRYAKAFMAFDNSLDYQRIIELYREGELRDIYRLLIFYISSIYTNNPKIMYALAGGIYAYLSYKCLLIFSKNNNRKLDINLFFCASIFYTFISLSNINGFRFWTGALVLFLSVYNIVIFSNKKWILPLIIVPFFHYGFIMSVPILILYSLFHKMFDNNKTVSKFLFIVFCVTFCLSWILETNSINIGFLTSSGLVDGAVGERLDYVNSSDTANLVNVRRSNSLFLSIQKYFDIAIKIMIFINIVYMKNRIENVSEIYKKRIIVLFNLVLFYYSFSFIALSFPSGSRFFNIGHLFFLLLIINFYNISKRNRRFTTLIFFLFLSFIFNILFTNFMLPILILEPSFWYGSIFMILIDGFNFIIY